MIVAQMRHQIFLQTIQIEEARAISLPTKFVKYGRKQIEPVLDSEFFEVTANTTENCPQVHRHAQAVTVKPAMLP